jgi:hypothetical protein
VLVDRDVGIGVFPEGEEILAKSSILHLARTGHRMNWLLVVKKKALPGGRSLIVDLRSANMKLARNRLVGSDERGFCAVGRPLFPNQVTSGLPVPRPEGPRKQHFSPPGENCGALLLRY